MQKSYENKSQKTKERAEIVHLEIQSLRESLQLLHDEMDKKFNKYLNNFAPRIVKYSSLPRQKEQFIFTINNLSSQVKLLESELVTLAEYGA